MATSARERIGTLLAGVTGHGSFAARRTADADDLHIEVRDVGELGFPLSRTQAKALCGVARPARYGRREETLLDEHVRDTCEVPKSRVKIDRRRWNRTLLPVLDRLRQDLGLPEGCTLEAQFQAMLVYAPGQFFLPHQDSEKSDEMVGTLVVTLPSSFRGGAFVIEHMGERRTWRGTKDRLQVVAFYADCHHEVTPVREGYRVVLTYNLTLDRTGAVDPGLVAEPEKLDAIAALVHEHFEKPLPPPPWAEDASPREPPRRLVYLLDHQYTERGCGWNRLKGNDVVRAMALRAVAEPAECEIVLALAQVHEIWDCTDDDWYEPRYGRSRSWEWDGAEWDADDDPPANDPDRYSLVSLVDGSTKLDRWMAPGATKPEPISTQVDDHEVCSTTPSVDLQPYASEYEGFMGNYGNTMDRWYRRAAVVLWPRERAFDVRAEASPTWALKELAKSIRSGSISEARARAERLTPFWRHAALETQARGFFGKTLTVAEGLDAPDVAATLLAPFRVEALTPRHARAFAALVRRYGEGWGRALLAAWSTTRRGYEASYQTDDRREWLASLPRICGAFSSADEENGRLAASLVVEDQWRWVTQAVEEARAYVEPSLRDDALRELAGPIHAFLEGAAIAEAGAIYDEAVTWLCAHDNEPLLPGLVGMLRLAGRSRASEARELLRLDDIRHRCIQVLEKLLAVPPRAKGDWSIEPPQGCGCDLCGTLAEFLAARDHTQLEWPLAKEKRKHVHRIIDTHELPVRHETRRAGRPYTLVLTKTAAVFADEAARRRSWATDLEWLGGGAPPPTHPSLIQRRTSSSSRSAKPS